MGMKTLIETKPCIACAATGRSMYCVAVCLVCGGRGYQLVAKTSQADCVISREPHSNTFSVATSKGLLNGVFDIDELKRYVEGSKPIPLGNYNSRTLPVARFRS